MIASPRSFISSETGENSEQVPSVRGRDQPSVGRYSATCINHVQGGGNVAPSPGGPHHAPRIRPSLVIDTFIAMSVKVPTSASLSGIGAAGAQPPVRARVATIFPEGPPHIATARP